MAEAYNDDRFQLAEDTTNNISLAQQLLAFEN